MRRRARASALWLPPVALMALIFALSSLPTTDMDKGLLEFVARKLAHFTEYALLTFLWWRALEGRGGDQARSPRPWRSRWPTRSRTSTTRRSSRAGWAP